jgi:hypothetical protein
MKANKFERSVKPGFYRLLRENEASVSITEGTHIKTQKIRPINIKRCFEFLENASTSDGW